MSSGDASRSHSKTGSFSLSTVRTACRSGPPNSLSFLDTSAYPGRARTAQAAATTLGPSAMGRPPPEPTANRTSPGANLSNGR